MRLAKCLTVILGMCFLQSTKSWFSKPVTNGIWSKQIKRFIYSTVSIFLGPNILLSNNQGRTDDLYHHSPIQLLSVAQADNRVTLDAEAQSLYRKARQVENEGDFPLAQSFYEQIVISYPELSVAWSDLGNVLTTRGNLDQALLCYKKALSLQPDPQNLSLILLNKAAILQGLGQTKEALRDLETAERTSGPSPVLTANKAVVLSNLGQWSDACSLFEQVISTADRNALPWWLRYSMALLETGRGMESLAFLQRTLNRFPDESEIKAYAAALYTSLGTGAEARRYWDKIPDTEKDQYKNIDSFVIGKLHWGPVAVSSFKSFLKTI